MNRRLSDNVQRVTSGCANLTQVEDISTWCYNRHQRLLHGPAQEPRSLADFAADARKLDGLRDVCQDCRTAQLASARGSRGT